VGISEHAVAAYLKAGNIKSAIDCCVHLNKWDAGVDLAEHHDFRQIETLLSKYATHLLEKNKTLHAIELYRKASHHTEAAKLLFKVIYSKFIIKSISWEKILDKKETYFVQRNCMSWVLLKLNNTEESC
jgi:hypothetical protein